MKQALKYLPHAGAALLLLLQFLIPSLQAFIIANPKSTVSVLLAGLIAAYHMTPPQSSPASKF